MIEYFEQLTQEEQEDLTDVIRLLYRQTFLLERKFDKRAGRLQYQREYRICEKHIDFLKMYFQIAGITLCENVHLGLIYIQDLSAGRTADGRENAKAGDSLSAGAEADL